MTPTATKKLKAVKPVADCEPTRREQILQVAARIFARDGYRNTDVQLIADELGIGKGTIYRQFPTKQELFLAAVDQGMDRLHAYTCDRSGMSDSSDLDSLKTAVRAYFEFFEKQPELIALFVQEMAEFHDRPKSTYAVYREKNMPSKQVYFQNLIDSNQVKKLPIRKLMDIISSVLYGTLMTHYFSGDKRPLTEKAEDVIDVVIEGLLKHS